MSLAYAYPLTKFAVLLTVYALIGSCSAKEKTDGSLGTIVLNDNAYHFPTIHGNSFTGPGHQFLRLKPNKSYMIIYSSNKNYRLNRESPTVPTISFVNDTGNDFDKFQYSGGWVVCRKPDLLRFGCGVQVIDAGLRWSVVFDRKDIGQAAIFGDQAAEILRRGRSAFDASRSSSPAPAASAS